MVEEPVVVGRMNDHDIRLGYRCHVPRSLPLVFSDVLRVKSDLTKGRSQNDTVSEPVHQRQFNVRADTASLG